jgi:4'-phosphopantetheinyl transferase
VSNALGKCRPGPPAILTDVAVVKYDCEDRTFYSVSSDETVVKTNWPEASDQVNLEGDCLHVWAVPLQIDDAQQQLLKTQLAADERQRADQYVRDEPRRNFIGSRAALRSILGRYLAMAPGDVPIVYDANGKPRLAGAAAETGLQFNLAHSGQVALVAVAYGCDVGVDVEQLRPIEHWQEIAARYFHAAETEAIAAAEPSERNAAFLRCWTRKEAILKALGVGLNHSLASFAVPLADCANAQVELPAPASAAFVLQRHWLQSVEPCPGYVAAVATGKRKSAATGLLHRKSEAIS